MEQAPVTLSCLVSHCLLRFAALSIINIHAFLVALCSSSSLIACRSWCLDIHAPPCLVALCRPSPPSVVPRRPAFHTLSLLVSQHVCVFRHFSLLVIIYLAAPHVSGSQHSSAPAPCRLLLSLVSYRVPFCVAVRISTFAYFEELMLETLQSKLNSL